MLLKRTIFLHKFHIPTKYLAITILSKVLSTNDLCFKPIIVIRIIIAVSKPNLFR